MSKMDQATILSRRLHLLRGVDKLMQEVAYHRQLDAEFQLPNSVVVWRKDQEEGRGYVGSSEF